MVFCYVVTRYVFQSYFGGRFYGVDVLRLYDSHLGQFLNGDTHTRMVG